MIFFYLMFPCWLFISCFPHSVYHSPTVIYFLFNLIWMNWYFVFWRRFDILKLENGWRFLLMIGYEKNIGELIKKYITFINISFYPRLDTLHAISHLSIIHVLRLTLSETRNSSWNKFTLDQTDSKEKFIVYFHSTPVMDVLRVQDLFQLFQ